MLLKLYDSLVNMSKSRLKQTLSKAKAGGRAVFGRVQKEECVKMLYNHCHSVTFPLIAL